VGGGTLLEIKYPRIEDYAVEDGVERRGGSADFEKVKRTKITHEVSWRAHDRSTDPCERRSRPREAARRAD